MAAAATPAAFVRSLHDCAVWPYHERRLQRAEVLDADAFAAFQEAGIFDAETASRFRHTILEKGGTIPPDELYRQFRGKDASADALLRRDGLLTE